MIISASRRTDIPAFYADWFLRRMQEGYLFVRSPFNAFQIKKIELTPNAVEGIVFWTKNGKPFQKAIQFLENNNYKYYFQYTITGYGKVLEPNVPPIDKSIEYFCELSDKIGAKKIFWRFDPIILTTISTVEQIVDKFKYIAARIDGKTHSVYISFGDIYNKVKNNMDKMRKEAGIEYCDINEDSGNLLFICQEIAGIAERHGLKVFSCAENCDFASLNIRKGSCIDHTIFNDIYGSTFKYGKDKGQRIECGCVESIDIGEYNTCKHGCRYCYANTSDKAVAGNFAKHNSHGKFLIANQNDDLLLEKYYHGPAQRSLPL